MRNDELARELSRLANIVEKMTPPIPAIPPIMPIPAIPPIVLSDDHNLLIRLDAKVDALKEDIKMLTDGTSTKINDHELRLRRLEVWGFTAIGILLALQFYFNFIK